MQWKIAVSWVSGYFIFQLFNPVLFRYHGPVVAGQMGMTLSVSNALLAGCSVWMNARSPEFGKLVSKREWQQLDRIFHHVLWQSVGVVVTGAIAGWCIIAYLQKYYQLGQRFVPASCAALLFGAVVVQIVINGFAVYLRAHKQEPFIFMSIIIAVIQGSATWFFGMSYSIIGVTESFLIVNGLVAMPLAYLIWSHSKKVWHLQ
jgi:hypothetical protein